MSGKPAARVGDKVAGNVIVSGSATVLIGDAGQGCADKACKGSPSVGSPVNPMLGIKVLPGETDFALAAPSPFVFTRSYASDDARIGPLGQGWSIPGASLYLEVSEAATVMVDPQGRRITFDALAPGESLFSPSESLWIRRGGPVPGDSAPPSKAWDGRWIGVPEAVQRDPNAIVAMAVSGNDAFVFLAGPTRWRLAQVVDRNSYATEYQWSATGDLRAIRDSAGRVYALVYAAHTTVQKGDNGLRLAGVVLAFDPGRDDKPRSTFDPLAKDNDWLVRYGYDAEGDLVEVIDRMGQSVRYFGYRQHIMVRHGQPNGIDVRYSYDQYSPQGKVLTQRNLEGLDYTFLYHRDRTVVTDSLGRVDTYQFAGEAGLKRLVKHVRADGSVVENKYDYAGRWVASVDPLGRTTRLRLDGEGRELGMTHPDGATESKRYDPQTSNLLVTEDALGRRVSITYDVRGNPVAVTEPDGAVTQYVYGLAGLSDRPVQIIDAKGGIKHLGWTRLGQMDTYTDCSNHTTSYAHDCDGNLTRITDALGNVTRYEHDRIGRLLTVKLPDGAVILSQRDLLGHVVNTTDPLGQVTRLKLDRFGRVVRHTNPQGHTQDFVYDSAGRLQTLTNENGAHFRFRYDVFDRLIDELGFDERRRQYRYNLAGDLMEVEDAGGLLTRFDRDAAGRVTALHVPATTAVPAYIQRYRYDAGGQILEAQTPESTVLMTYDVAGRLTAETQRHADGWQYHHRQRYDILGEREESQYEGVPPVNWLTYGSGHLHGVRVGDFGVDFERDLLHREINRTILKNEISTGLESRKKYDFTGRLTGQKNISNRENQAKINWNRDYFYDASGRIIDINDNQHGLIKYYYDTGGRLIGSNHSGRSHNYNYDPAGNRVDEHLPVESFIRQNIVINNRNAEINGVMYYYDMIGNVVGRVAPDGERLEMSYDGQNRMVAVKRSNGVRAPVIIKYSYDAFGRRLMKEVNNIDGEALITKFGWDFDNMVAEVSGIYRKTIVYEPKSFIPLMSIKSTLMSADIASEVRYGQAAELFPLKIGNEIDVMYFDTNHAGAPVELNDCVGRIFWRGDMKDWGGVDFLDGCVIQPIGFQGQYLDEETGIYYNRHRYYDEVGGKYLSQDPAGIRAGINLYEYANNSPINRVDPFGLAPKAPEIRNHIPEFENPFSEDKSTCRQVCEVVTNTVCTNASGAVVKYSPHPGVKVAGAVVGLTCQPVSEYVCKWVCDQGPPVLNRPTNNFAQPGGCGTSQCLMYI